MIGIILLCLAIPAFALGWVAATRRPSRDEWPIYFKRVGTLFLIGAVAASPFLTTRSLGTSEAYNYSLSVADAVTQFRAGVVPAMVGQSEFAFNGRIHPLRTAPYLTYFAGLLDAATFHRLNFWSLQNLSLALSLIGAAFSMYTCLRGASNCTPKSGLYLSAGYVFCPAVMAAAYGMDLYMTVTAIPFVPVVLLANALAWKGDRHFPNYVRLAAGLAACWWAHPPVAWWMTVTTLLLHLPLLFTGRIRWTEIKILIAAGVIGLALTGFVFLSSLSITSYNSMSAARAPQAVVDVVRESFRDSLRPISSTGDKLGDFQLGYAYWALLLVGFALAFVRRNGRALVFLLGATAIVVFTIPVPGITRLLWHVLPTFALTLNGPWPMQRLYLVVTALILFGVAQLGSKPDLGRWPKFVKDGISLVTGIAVVWTAYESSRMILRGLSFHGDAAATRAVHASENINLTLIAYAMFKTPPTFTNGVMDPMMDLRVLRRGDTTELLNNMNAQAAWGPVVKQGTLVSRSGDGDIAVLSPQLQLEPGRRYRLDFNFHLTPTKAMLRVLGPNTDRTYPLPQSGNEKAFGMAPGNRHGFTIWTSSKQTETIELQIVGPGMGSARLLNFADFTLRTYDPNKLPIRLESLVPLRAHVTSPEPGYLESPRVFIEGYRATVNGQIVRAPRSPDGLVMAPIPAGESEVEIDYVGPPGLRTSFWISLCAWIGLLGTSWTFFLVPSTRVPAARVVGEAGDWFWRRKFQLIAISAVAVVAVWGWKKWDTFRNAAGPLRLMVIFPRGETGRSQPLVTTGHPNEGTFIFAIYQDPTHIKVGVDVWGVHYWVSDPIPFDYFAEHEFVVSSGALYPPGHPKLKSIPADQLKALRNRISVQLDGKLVLDRPVFSFDSKLSEVTVGESRIGVSSTEPKFAGTILKAERLPIPSGN